MINFIADNDANSNTDNGEDKSNKPKEDSHHYTAFLFLIIH